jgi:flagellar protein FliO/FliZ
MSRRSSSLGSVITMTLAFSATLLPVTALAQAAPKAAPALQPTPPVQPTSALAAPPAPAAPVVVAPAPTIAPPVEAAATPLAVRPTPATHLTLAPSSEGIGTGLKVLAILGVGGALAFFIRRKRTATAIPASRISIVARESLGVRSEVVVLDVEGTRLLVGLTPTTMQTLAVLDPPEADGLDTAEEEPFQPDETFGDRVRSLLGAVETSPPRVAAAKPVAPAKPRPSMSRPLPSTRSNKSNLAMRDVAGQARGLLLSSDEGE